MITNYLGLRLYLVAISFSLKYISRDLILVIIDEETDLERIQV